MPPKHKRHDFPIAVKQKLAQRAAYFCSNPRCIKLTSGPHSNPDKSLLSGHAAHICAAAPGGARYNLYQTETQRCSAANGIWLCRECGSIVDNDEVKYPEHLLHRWKSDHESIIAEVRIKGYSDSLRLLQAGDYRPKVAKQIIALMEDRRALWEIFDAEIPTRVRHSLDHLRSELVSLRREVPDGDPLDEVLRHMVKTIHVFHRQVEHADIDSLCCGDLEWSAFEGSLQTLRKSLGLQIKNLATATGILVGPNLQEIMPITFE